MTRNFSEASRPVSFYFNASGVQALAVQSCVAITRSPGAAPSVQSSMVLGAFCHQTSFQSCPVFSLRGNKFCEYRH